MVVIAIIALISVVSLVSLGNKPAKDELEISTEELVSYIRLEQARAMATENCLNFGVERVDDFSYKLLCSNQIINLRTGITLSQGKVSFIPPEPEVNLAFNFKLNTITISVNQNGSIEIQ